MWPLTQRATSSLHEVGLAISTSPPNSDGQYDTAPSSANQEHEGVFEDTPSTDDVVIALMGVTGSGKSTFIKTVTGRDDIQIGHGLTSETIECEAYRFQEDGVSFSLVDTPGFNDTYLDDAAILAQLAAFMESSYRASVKLTAIIYLHPIINARLEGSALDNLRMFRKLCGSQFYSNIMLATSFWSKVDHSTGQRRETQLREQEDFWGGMLAQGSQMTRLPDERAECITLLLHLCGKRQTALQIQEELVDQGLQIAQTEAGAIANDSGALEELRQIFSQRLALLTSEKQAALDRQREEFAKIQQQQQDIFEAQLKQYQEALQESLRAHEALHKQAQERQQKALKEHEESNRRTLLDMERMKAELERLKLKEEQEQRKEEEEQARQKLQLRWKQIYGQIGLLESARKAGTCRVLMSRGWFDGLSMRRQCDFCFRQLPVQISYSCTSCPDADTCSTCWELGHRCRKKEHTGFARRNLMGTEAGKCGRARFPPWTRYRIPCDRCGRYLDGTFLHCCGCKSDNFDLCVQCAVKGWTCLDSSHVLQVMTA